MVMLVLIIAWVLAIPASVLACFLLFRRTRASAPSCPACGHDVRGLSAPRCVECGSSLEGGVVPIGGLTRRRRWGLVAVILLLTLALVWSAFTWGGQVMFLIATWRLANQREVDIRVELVLEAPAGERFSLALRGIDRFDEPDVVRIMYRIEEPGADILIWEEVGPGTWTHPLGTRVDGAVVAADLAARLDGPKGLLTRALLEDPQAFAAFLTSAAAAPGLISTTVPGTGGVEPFQQFESSSLSETGSRMVSLMPTVYYHLPSRISLALALLVLFPVGWILLRPGLVDWSEYEDPPSS